LSYLQKNDFKKQISKKFTFFAGKIYLTMEWANDHFGVDLM